MSHLQQRGPVQVTLERGMLRLRRGNPQAEGLYDPDTTNALRAFFQAERDQELGRWRDTENPDCICYPVAGDPDDIWVVYEGSGLAYMRERNQAFYAGNKFSEVARRYFAAHPEPKPWHDAKAGEYWLVTLEGADPTPTTVGNYCENLYFVVGDDDYYCPTNDHRIQNAVRLTPEEDNDE